MPVDIRDQGQYELFETTQHHKVLVLDKNKWFAAVKGQQGDILVKSDADHQKDHTLQNGRFYLADFQNDPKFKDMTHLFLEKDGKYQEVVLPNGLPTDRDNQKKIVWTSDTMKKEDLENYLQHPRTAGAGEERANRPGGKSNAQRESSSSSKQGSKSGGENLPIANFDDLTVDEVKSKLNHLSSDDLNRIRHYEQQHKKRKTLLEAMERKH